MKNKNNTFFTDLRVFMDGMSDFVSDYDLSEADDGMILAYTYYAYDLVDTDLDMDEIYYEIFMKRIHASLRDLMIEDLHQDPVMYVKHQLQKRILNSRIDDPVLLEDTLLEKDEDKKRGVRMTIKTWV